MGRIDASLSIPELLRAVREGDESAAGQLFARIYDELHGLAHRVRGRGTPSVLNTTALVP